MKGNYVTTQILLACLSKPVSLKKQTPAEVNGLFSKNNSASAIERSKLIADRKAA
jgi:hypothetical protein